MTACDRAASPSFANPSAIGVSLPRIVALAAWAALLAACASGPGGVARVDLAGAAAGSTLAQDLSRGDEGALEAALAAALSEDAVGAERAWRGETARGAVVAGEYVLGGVDFGGRPRPAIPAGLYLDDPIETDLGLHALTRNSNVRLGPGTSFQSLEQMDAGDPVEVVGRVSGKPWMLVEAEGRIRGYIHENLMIKQPGAELELAGGPTKRAVRCREFEQRLSVSGRSDEWTGVACEREGRWRVEPRADNAPTLLY